MIQVHRQQDIPPMRTWSDLSPVQTQWQAVYEHSKGTTLEIIAHIALRALSREQQGRKLYSMISTSNAPTFVKAYQLCDALNVLQEALEDWLYVAARLWYLLDHSHEAHQQPTKEVLAPLHAASIDEHTRLFSVYLLLQEHMQKFLSRNHILVTMNILDQQAEDFLHGESEPLKRPRALPLSCSCGHILRAPKEQKTQKCFECSIAASLNQYRQTIRKQLFPHHRSRGRHETANRITR